MNVFSTPTFLEAAGELFFPGRRRSIELCRVEGRLLRLLVLDGREVVQAMPFYDFPQPLEAADEEPVRELRYFPRTVVRTTTIEERVAPEPEGHQPSPYIDWSSLGSLEAWRSLVDARGANRFGDPARSLRRLRRDVGELRFVFDDPRPEVFDACVQWKAAQYRATGVGDAFARPESAELFRRLRTRGAVVVSSLTAGDTLLAAHLGSITGGRLGWWVPAYDPAWRRYAPGRLLLLELIAESFRRGDVEFDFLIGAEDYKFLYATHNRVVGPVGTPPLGVQVLAATARRAKALLAGHPRAYALARQLRRQMQHLRP